MLFLNLIKTIQNVLLLFNYKHYEQQAMHIFQVILKLIPKNEKEMF